MKNIDTETNKRFCNTSTLTQIYYRNQGWNWNNLIIRFFSAINAITILLITKACMQWCIDRTLQDFICIERSARHKSVSKRPKCQYFDHHSHASETVPVLYCRPPPPLQTFPSEDLQWCRNTIADLPPLQTFPPHIISTVIGLIFYIHITCRCCKGIIPVFSLTDYKFHQRGNHT